MGTPRHLLLPSLCLTLPLLQNRGKGNSGESRRGCGIAENPRRKKIAGGFPFFLLGKTVLRFAYNIYSHSEGGRC